MLKSLTVQLIGFPLCCRRGLRHDLGRGGKRFDVQRNIP